MKGLVVASGHEVSCHNRARDWLSQQGMGLVVTTGHGLVVTTGHGIGCHNRAWGWLSQQGMEMVVSFNTRSMRNGY